MTVENPKPFLRALAGEHMVKPPWWLMRQAGRYLPEYRELRAKAGDFITLCLTPEWAAEVTLQPIRRFGMDAAILFSDILLVPRALGQGLGFHEDGPVLSRIDDAAGLSGLQTGRIEQRLAPVFEAAQRVKGALPAQTALIGFAGAPWTVATYMVEGGASKDYHRVKAWAYRDPGGFGTLIEIIVEATIDFLSGQIKAGAEVVQLFDSWAGVLPEVQFERWVVAPTRRIVSEIKTRFPNIRVIGFPRACGWLYPHYAETTGVDAVSLDTAVPVSVGRRLQGQLVIQGNLDPVALMVGGAALESEVTRLRAGYGDGAWIFNLGHGVLPQTPPEHVAALAGLLREPT